MEPDVPPTPSSGPGPSNPSIDLDAWSMSIVATALKILWVEPADEITEDIRRRIARAEALRSGRRFTRSGAPMPDVATSGMAESSTETISAG